MPLISVCIPTYKGEKYIKETLKSVKSQNFSDYEIVMNEDMNGKGLGWNLNELVKKAKGQILVFLARDDILLPGSLALSLLLYQKSKNSGSIQKRTIIQS